MKDGLDKQTNEQVNQFDAYKGSYQTAYPIDEQVSAKQGTGTDRLVGNPFQRQGYQRRNDERIEDDSRQDGTFGTVKPHDVKGTQLRNRNHEQGRNDFCSSIGCP